MAYDIVTIVLLSLTLCVTGLNHKGREFILAFMENPVMGMEYAVCRLYITSNSVQPVTVYISVPLLRRAFPPANYTLYPEETITHEFSDDILKDGSGRGEEGILIEASDEITVQGANVNTFSTDAFLALPTHALGTDYYTICYFYEGESAWNQWPSEFIIVGTEDYTEVNVTLAPGIDSSDVEGVRFRNDVYTRTLDRYETLQIQSLVVDLSGMRIQSTSPVAVFSGAAWSSVGSERMGDHLVEQIPPVPTWGVHFLTSPVTNRSAGDIFKVVAQHNDTRVRVVRDTSRPKAFTQYIIDVGETVEFEGNSTAGLEIISNHAVMLTQFCKSSGADNNSYSDPFMSLVPPVQQYSGNYTFSTVTSRRVEQGEFSHFLNIIAETRYTDQAVLNDEPLHEYSVPSDWKQIASSPYSMTTVALEEGFYALALLNGKPLSGFLYGLKKQESYGHVLGQQADEIPYACYPAMESLGDHFDNDCDQRFDEEIADGIDNDGDGLIDEDVVFDPSMIEETSVVISSDHDQTTTQVASTVHLTSEGLSTSIDDIVTSEFTSESFTSAIQYTTGHADVITTESSVILTTENFNELITTENAGEISTESTSEGSTQSNIVHTSSNSEVRITSDDLRMSSHAGVTSPPAYDTENVITSDRQKTSDSPFVYVGTTPDNQQVISTESDSRLEGAQSTERRVTSVETTGVTSNGVTTMLELSSRETSSSHERMFTTQDSTVVDSGVTSQNIGLAITTISPIIDHVDVSSHHMEDQENTTVNAVSTRFDNVDENDGLNTDSPHDTHYTSEVTSHSMNTREVNDNDTMSFVTPKPAVKIDGNGEDMLLTVVLPVAIVAAILGLVSCWCCVWFFVPWWKRRTHRKKTRADSKELEGKYSRAASPRGFRVSPTPCTTPEHEEKNSTKNKDLLYVKKSQPDVLDDFTVINITPKVPPVNISELSVIKKKDYNVPLVVAARGRRNGITSSAHIDLQQFIVHLPRDGIKKIEF